MSCCMNSQQAYSIRSAANHVVICMLLALEQILQVDGQTGVQQMLSL
jgi:hypothetical protein